MMNDNFWLVALLHQQKGCDKCVSSQTSTYVSVGGYLGTHEACVSSYVKTNQNELAFKGVIPYCNFQSAYDETCIQCA